MTEYAVTIHIVTDIDIRRDIIEGAIADAIDTQESIYDCVERKGAEVETWWMDDIEVKG